MITELQATSTGTSAVTGTRLAENIQEANDAGQLVECGYLERVKPDGYLDTGERYAEYAIYADGVADLDFGAGPRLYYYNGAPDQLTPDDPDVVEVIKASRSKWTHTIEVF